MMFKLLSSGLVIIPTLIAATSFSPRAAIAACAITDVGVQVHIGDTPARQNNNVNSGVIGSCVGNSSTSTGTQLSIGSGRTTQNRNSSHLVGGSQRPPGVNFDTPVVTTEVHVPVSVQTPRFR